MPITEAEDFVELVESISEAVQKAKADGKINWKDTVVIPAVIVAAKKALEGSGIVVGEVKGANGEELEHLISEAVSAFASLFTAIFSKTPDTEAIEGV